MKHLVFLMNDKQNYKKAKKETKKSLYTSMLIQVFTGLTDKKIIKEQLEKLADDFPNAIIIGTTTAGEISHATMHDHTTVISLSLFKNTKLKAYYSKKIDKDSGTTLSQNICSQNTKAAIILSEGLKGDDYEAFIKSIKVENPELLIAGGLAGDNFALKKTYIFFGTKIYKKGAISVSFSGKKLFAQNRYNLNWTPIGKEFTITSSQGNRVEKIDNEPAVVVFKRYLGEDIFHNNASALSDFQMLYKEGQTVVSRTPMSVDGESIIFAGPLKKGQKVQFGFSNASSVISGSNDISQSVSKNPAEAIFIYSCIARKTLLGKTLEDEFKSFESLAPTAGFFTYGEFYSTNKNNALLNCTTTILVLSEENKQKEKKAQINSSFTHSLDNITFQALTHFIKQTSEELQINSELLQEYKDAVDQSSLVSKTTKDGTIIYVNDNFCKISKYKQEELLGKNHNIIRDPKMSASIFEEMWTTILSGKVWKGTLSNRAKDNSIYFVDATIMPITNKDGEIIEFIAIRQNITKQIESKRKIQDKEKVIKVIFDNQEGIVLFSSKIKGMIRTNKKFFDYFNFHNFEDFKNQHKCICDLFIEEEGYIYPSKYPNWIDDAAHETSSTDRKVKMLTKDGMIRTFKLIVKQINDEYIINLNDITTLEEAIIKANASEQAKTIFLANMSHEIRTPLNGILGFTDVLTKKELDPDAKRFVNIIHQSGQTLLNVVNDILDFSKIESGELPLYEETADLFSQMESTVSTFASVSKQKHIDYYTFIDSNIPKSLHCDIQRLKQVVNNLISNAIKFTPENGFVRVSIKLVKVHNSKAHILFSVKDSGIGIPKNKHDSVFQAFAQADNSTSRKFGGTGLGLSISQQYIQMMHSKIELKSEENRGSEFYFTLQLPIVDTAKSLTQITQEIEYGIVILQSKEEISCGINEIVSTYFQIWNIPFRTINSLDALQNDDRILMVCAQLFDKHTCTKALNDFPQLHLLYVEGAKETFSCEHERFHLLEQPMTGSLLFDRVITLSNAESIVTENQNHVQAEFSYIGKILVAEDNETNQILIGVLLEERNLEFTLVNNGQEAVDEANKADYDIILMDINMPVMDGITATKILRENGYKKPIVSLSANVIETDRASFLSAGVNDTLNKPIVPNELDKTLKKYLTPTTEEEVIIDFDTLDLASLSKVLGIQDLHIIVKLLESFASSLTTLSQEIESEGINEDNLHKLKGLSGNLRFNKLYTLTQKYEKEIKNWNEAEFVTAQKMLSQHIEHIMKEIDALDK